MKLSTRLDELMCPSQEAHRGPTVDRLHLLRPGQMLGTWWGAVRLDRDGRRRISVAGTSAPDENLSAGSWQSKFYAAPAQAIGQNVASLLVGFVALSLAAFGSRVLLEQLLPPRDATIVLGALCAAALLGVIAFGVVVSVHAFRQPDVPYRVAVVGDAGWAIVTRLAGVDHTSTGPTRSATRWLLSELVTAERAAQQTPGQAAAIGAVAAGIPGQGMWKAPDIAAAAARLEAANTAVESDTAVPFS